MMKHPRLWIALLVCVVLMAPCCLFCGGFVGDKRAMFSPYPDPEFVTAEHGFAWKIPDYCDIGNLAVWNAESHEIAWQLRAQNGIKLTHLDYGVVPANMQEIISAEPLKDGDRVAIEIDYGYLEWNSFDCGSGANFHAVFEVAGTKGSVTRSPQPERQQPQFRLVEQRIPSELWLLLESPDFHGPVRDERQVQISPRRIILTSNQADWLGLTDDGQRLAVADGASVRLFDTASGKEIGSIPETPAAQQVFMSPDGSRVGFLRENDVQVVDVMSGKWLSTLKRSGQRLIFGAFSRDGKTIASAAEDPDGLQLWEVPSGKDLRRFRVPITEPRAELAFSPDGRQLAVSGCDPVRVSLFEIETGMELARFDPPPGMTGPRSMSFSPDGRLLAAGYEREEARGSAICVWDTTSHKVAWMCTLPPRKRGRQDNVERMAFSANGRNLFVVFGSHSLRAWEVASGDLRYYAEDVRFNALEDPFTFVSTAHHASLAALLRSDSDTHPAPREIFLWDTRRIPLVPAPVASADQEKAWHDLAGRNARAAYQSMREMASLPVQFQQLVATRLLPGEGRTREEIETLVRQLDDQDLDTRRAAKRRLAELEDRAWPVLAKTRAAKGNSDELSQSIGELLDGIPSSFQGEPLRYLRTIEVLESIDSPQSRPLLEQLRGEIQSLAK